MALSYTWYQLRGRAQTSCYGVEPTVSTFHHLRFGMKFILSLKIERIVEGKGLNSSHGISTDNSSLLFTRTHTHTKCKSVTKLCPEGHTTPTN
jgi:hypothetical protein